MPGDRMEGCFKAIRAAFRAHDARLERRLIGYRSYGTHRFDTDEKESTWEQSTKPRAGPKRPSGM